MGALLLRCFLLPAVHVYCLQFVSISITSIVCPTSALWPTPGHTLRQPQWSPARVHSQYQPARKGRDCRLGWLGRQVWWSVGGLFAELDTAAGFGRPVPGSPCRPPRAHPARPSPIMATPGRQLPCSPATSGDRRQYRYWDLPAACTTLSPRGGADVRLMSLLLSNRPFIVPHYKGTPIQGRYIGVMLHAFMLSFPSRAFPQPVGTQSCDRGSFQTFRR